MVDNAAGSGISSGNSHIVFHYVPAIILYPSLTTPSILTGTQVLEILLIGKGDQPVRRENVSVQLKVDNELNARKRYRAAIIPIDWITIDQEGVLNDSIIKTHGKFKGMLDSRALALFRSHGYTKYYSIRVQNNSLFQTQGEGSNRGLFNLIWVHYGSPMVRPPSIPGICLSTPVPPEDEIILMLNPVNNEDPENPKVIANELHDHIIAEVLNQINGSRIPERGKYCFRNIYPSVINLNEPVQSYHPVFYFNELSSANIAFISDIHVCSRQNILSKSNVRVIEYTNDIGIEEDESISHGVGSMVNNNIYRLRDLLNSFGEDSQVHMVLIGGDLIDYIKSLYTRSVNNNPDTGIAWRAREIWETIGLNDNYERHYQDYVDHISIYSLLIDFYRTHKKPIFIVNGNHDAYYWPYGISPRVTFLWKRANEGIPADHNLTLYEAILAFGDTYHEVKAPGATHVNFLPDKLKWFYSVFTPFSDFAIHLPNQCISGFAWGEEEDILDIGDQGFGHLPRSDNAISERQLSFFEDIQRNRADRKVIFFSHFTFVSYAEHIPVYPLHEGDVEFDSWWNAGDYDRGTFETSRKRMYEYHIAQQRDIQCIFTGHSHRKGLYTVERTDYSGDNSVKTGFFELNNFGFSRTNINTRYPAIVVSDSAGPLPRYNKCGEFYGWGNYYPSGTRVLFNNDGSISSIGSNNAHCQPRFIVSLDYMDLIKKEKVITSFKCAFPSDSEYFLTEYAFRLMIHSHAANLAYVDSPIFLYARSDRWYKIDLSYSNGFWRTSEVSRFRRYFGRPNVSTIFIAVKFSMKPEMSDRIGHYDFNSYWCFPVKIEPDHSSGNKIYEIVRDSDLVEIPDFEWRKNEFEKYR